MFTSKQSPIRTILTVGLLFSLFLLACGISLPGRDQVEGGLATARAVGESAVELATGAAPTLEALQTQVVDLATGAAPTRDAGLDQLATAAARAQGTGENVQATLAAAGIDGNYLLEKIKGMQPNENGQIVLEIAELELNLILQSRQALAVDNQEAVIVPGATVRLADGLINFTGEMTNPVNGTVAVALRPVVEEGTIRFEVVTADLNGSQVPEALLGTVEAALNTALLSSLNTALVAIPGGYGIQGVTVANGMMVVVAGR